MDIRLCVKSGDRVQIERDSQTYTSVVDEMLDENSLIITEPWSKRKKLQLRDGESLLIRCVNELGLTLCMTEVAEVINRGNLQLYRLKMMERYRRIQRREGFRAVVALDLMIRRMIRQDLKKKNPGTAHMDKARSVDISESGMQIYTELELNKGGRVEVFVVLNRYGFNERLPKMEAEVVRIVKAESGGYRVGLRFVDLPDRLRYKLAQFVTYSQRKDIN